MRTFLAQQWEFWLSAAAFIVSAYAAVWFVLDGKLGYAGFLLFCCYGFFSALVSFGAPVVMRREQRPEEIDGN